MPAVSDYVDITPRAAREQWAAITARSWPLDGKRQVAFTPVETLLCLAASLMVNHRRYGGKTSHLAEEPLPSLARLFKRSNGSVLAKIGNLYGGLTHGARHEVEVAARLLGEEGELARVYRIVVRAARDVGIGVDTLCDFLLLEHDEADLLLLGQEEVSTDVIISEVHATHPDLVDPVTEQVLVSSVRIGQHRFARSVLANHGHRCVFCGLAVAVDDRRASRMLIASHIKPWAASTSLERLDVANGLTACPTHDVAFDTGLMFVNGGLRIHVHPDIAHHARTDPAMHAAFGRPPLAERLLLPDKAVLPESKYLTWHREHISQGS